MSDDEYLLDLDAFAPAPGKHLKFKDRIYAVRNFSDLPADDVFLILRAEQEMRGKSAAEQLETGLRYIAMLVPDMDRPTMGGLSSRKILHVLQEAMGAAEVPPGGGDGPSGSPTSSPSSPDSTAGTSTKSAG